MEDDKMITPITPAIGVTDIRKLLEVTNTLGRFLSHDEFLSIMNIYLAVANRLEKEGQENEVNSVK